MKCPILTAKDYKLGFDNNLIFNGFRGNSINWRVDSKLTFTGFNEEGQAEFIGTDKEWE